MGKDTIGPSAPRWDPEAYQRGMDRANELLQKGCHALDEARFWHGVALGTMGLLAALGTALCHPAETIEDLCTPDNAE
jgi:hypothetical protein